MTRVQELGGRRIEQHNSPNIGGPMNDPRGIVLHIAQGSYKGTISWQMNPNQRYASGGSVTTSSTWIVGREAGEWAQMVDTARIAWCQRGGSRDWHSIELAGYAPAAPSAWQIEACAHLLAWHHRTYGTPLAVADHPGDRGLGHHAMDREWLGEEWGHDECPGKGVIAAKQAIVARAQAIVNGNGEDDDVSRQDVIDGVYLALVYAADPTKAPDETAAKTGRQTRDALRAIVGMEATSPTELAAALDRLNPTSAQEVITGVLAGLTPDKIAAAIPPAMAQRVADELAARMRE